MILGVNEALSSIQSKLRELTEATDSLKSDTIALRNEFVAISSPATPVIGYAVGEALPTLEAERIHGHRGRAHSTRTRIEDTSKIVQYTRAFKKMVEQKHYSVNRQVAVDRKSVV